MASSRQRRRVALGAAALGALVGALAACERVMGLSNYSIVDGVDAAGESFDSGQPDSSEYDTGAIDSTVDVAVDGGDSAVDADASDATVNDGAGDGPFVSDAPIEAPELATLWAQWPMPNPDAAIAPDSATRLPNPMTYDAGADGGATTALDLVTGLTWSRTPVASDAVPTASTCTAPFRVPTRIQLVSLLDFTQAPPLVDPATFNPTGAFAADTFWTSSVALASDGGASGYWTVDFSTGIVSNVALGHYVLCVEGP